MTNARKYKIPIFIALFIEFIIFFILFGKIRNLILATSTPANNTYIYLLLILAILIILFFFIISVLLTNRKTSEENLFEKNKEFSDTVANKKMEEKEKYDEETYDIEAYIKKILPKEDTKLDLIKYTEKILSNVAKEFDIVQGLFFTKDKKDAIFNIAGKYAYFGEDEPKSFKIGESLSGQVAKNKRILYLKEVPENYITILSGLGSSSPNHLVIIPIIVNNETIGIVELASFKEFKDNFINLLEKLSEQIGKVLIKY